MQLVTNWNDTNYSDSPSANLEAARGQGSEEPLFMSHVWSGCCRRTGLQQTPPHTGRGEELGEPHLGRTHQKLPPVTQGEVVAKQDMVWWPGISAVFIPKGHLARLAEAATPPEVLPLNQRILLPALSSPEKNKGFLFWETSQEKLKSNELSGVSSFKNIYGNSTVC